MVRFDNLVHNRLIETYVPLQLISSQPKLKKSEELLPSEVHLEFQNLKEMVFEMKEKMLKIEDQFLIRELAPRRESPPLDSQMMGRIEKLIEGKNITRYDSSLAEGKKMKKLEERMKQVEGEICLIKEVLVMSEKEEKEREEVKKEEKLKE